MLTRFLSSLIAAVFMGVVSASPVTAETLGEAEYMAYCASCHGVAADGKGPMAEFMSVRVPDLTTIAQRNDGAFPFLKVVHMIDGRSGIMAHGTEMPVWGDRFSVAMSDGMKGDLSPVYNVRGRILSLAYYLEGIQK